MGGTSLPDLLAQAVGNDGAALQAWTQKALDSKRQGDGTSFSFADSVCARALRCVCTPFTAADGLRHDRPLMIVRPGVAVCARANNRRVRVLCVARGHLFSSRTTPARWRHTGTHFQELVDMIDRNTDVVEQAVLVSCLSRCTGSLHKKRHGSLTAVVLQRCFCADEDLAAAVTAFAVNCVSVNAELLASILHELVKHFAKFNPLSATPPEHEAEAASRAERGEQADHASEEALAEAQNARNVHTVVQRVLETFPTGTMCLLDQLVQAFPHRVRRAAEQRAYLANILQV